MDGIWIGEWIYWQLIHTTQNYTVEITDTHRLVSSVYSSLQQPFPDNGFTSCDSSASRTYVLLSQSPVQNSCQLTTQLTRSQAGGNSHQPPSFLFTGWPLTENWTLSLTNQLLHFTSLHSTKLQSKSKSSYFTTGGLPLISSSWRQAPWDPWPETFFRWTLTVIVLKLHPLWWEDRFFSYKYAWPFVKCTYHTYGRLLKILPFALYTSPLSVQALLSRSCLSYVSYVITAA
jgi:hypothetical protein